jgi:hypothetical protein
MEGTQRRGTVNVERNNVERDKKIVVSSQWAVVGELGFENHHEVLVKTVLDIFIFYDSK